jgi:L-asparaginase II
MPDAPLPPTALVTRDGVIESVHTAHVGVVTPHGDVAVIAGDPSATIYPRSSLKPLQALAARRLLAEHGHRLDGSQLAIACASHVGSDDHQIEVAAVLAEADLDEGALACPPDWPEDAHARSDTAQPTALAHNCSGKHAAMLWAQTASGHGAEGYLDVDGPLQQYAAGVMAELLGAPPEGPGVDGCGAPAWRCAAGDLGRAFARLAEGADEETTAVRDAMTGHPVLVGGRDLPDTSMMWVDARVVAKRGADGVMACGFRHRRHGPLGIVVKVVDGGNRAAGPIAAAVLHALGAALPTDVLRTPVLGGGVPHGTITAAPEVSARTTELFGLS